MKVNESPPRRILEYTQSDLLVLLERQCISKRFATYDTEINNRSSRDDFAV